MKLEAGDRLVIHTPGGGGFGAPVSNELQDPNQTHRVGIKPEGPDQDAKADEQRGGTGNKRPRLAAVGSRGSVQEYKARQEGA